MNKSTGKFLIRMNLKQFLFSVLVVISFMLISSWGCNSTGGQVDNQTYRNIAKRRSAYHSSSYDYNLTAQLTTDGLIASDEPATINLYMAGILAAKNQW
jgi:hypothetical protein